MNESIKKQLEGYLTNATFDLLNFVFKGHVCETFPQFEAEGYFHRSVIFEGTFEGQTIQVVYHDEGNQHLVFECLANVDDMKSYLERKNPGMAI